jgi:hypothetical protein
MSCLGYLDLSVMSADNGLALAIMAGDESANRRKRLGTHDRLVELDGVE